MQLTKYQEVMRLYGLKIAESLSKKNIKLTNDSRDGRINSTQDEDIIIPEIVKIVRSDKFFKHININSPKERHWFDFSLEINEYFLPYNVKSSTLSGNDNVGAKLSLVWVVGGVMPTKECNKWNGWAKAIGDNINEFSSDKDYGFIIVNKNNPRDVIFQRLRSIEELISNASNPPYQCKWGRNREEFFREPEEQLRYLY